MKKILLAIYLMVLPSLEVGADFVETGRLAIVVGNGSYRQALLEPPPNDADAVAAQDLGFETRVSKNVDLIEMRAAISSMIAAARGAEIVMLFYAGHGVQSQGINYLLPIGFEVDSTDDLPEQAIALNDIIGWISEAGIGTGLLFLDACRDPLVDNGLFAPGLALVESAESELVVSYAAAAGAVAYDGVGPNSPYSTALVEALREPGLEIYEILRTVRGRVRQMTDGRQVPWVSGSVERRIILNDDDVKPAAETTAFSPTDPSWLDDTAWVTIQNSANPSYFRDFVADFPSSRYVRAALGRIETLTGQGMQPIPASYAISPAAADPGDGSTGLIDPLAAEVTRCDLLAASDIDPLRIAPGVPIHAVNTQDAILACTRDLESQLNAPQLLYQLARSLAVAERWEEAFHYAELAAEQDYAEAFSLMARIHADGLGIARDPGRAIALWRGGAKRGSPNARVNLGRSYRDGFGLEISFPDDLYWLKLAATTGEKIAADDLCNMYRRGQGVPADPREAMGWNQVGAALGSSNAANNIGNMYKNGTGVGRDAGQATHWYKRAIEQGNRYAPFQLARLMLLEGEGVDAVEALNLFLLAGDRGFPEAYAYAAALYETGRGVEKLPGQAYYFYLLARGGGFERAQEDAERVKAMLERSEAAAIEARATAWLDQNGDAFRRVHYPK